MNIEKIDKEVIKSGIELNNLAHLSRLDVFSVIDSTNTYLMKNAKNGHSGWVCLADQQTAGRGRRGRTWFSPPGSNIYCSLLWRFQKLPENISGLSIAVAVMVVKMLLKYGVQQGLQLKWPNDIWWNGRKLAGILLEKNQNDIVIGIGINLFLPPNAEKNWVALFEIMNVPLDRNRLIGLLINELLTGLPRFEEDGLNPFLEMWDSFDLLKGKMITLETPVGQVTGIAQGLDKQGGLLLRTDKGEVLSFCYGEVSVQR